MSRLLPSNQPLKEQKFAEFVDKSLIHDNDVITLDPLGCHFSLLEHIALGFGASIAGMNEKEARLYLSKIEKIKTQRGTAGAVEDTLEVTFEEAELVEWFEADDLNVGEFRVAVTVKADAQEKYDKRKFSLSKRLINEAKNVRSYLADFEIKLPESYCHVDMYGGGVIAANLTCDVEPFLAEAKFNIGGAVVWTF
jgi:P2-related tail formation protein